MVSAGAPSPVDRRSKVLAWSMMSLLVVGMIAGRLIAYTFTESNLTP